MKYFNYKNLTNYFCREIMIFNTFQVRSTNKHKISNILQVVLSSFGFSFRLQEIYQYTEGAASCELGWDSLLRQFDLKKLVKLKAMKHLLFLAETRDALFPLHTRITASLLRAVLSSFALSFWHRTTYFILSWGFTDYVSVNIQGSSVIIFHNKLKDQKFSNSVMASLG